MIIKHNVTNVLYDPDGVEHFAVHEISIILKSRWDYDSTKYENHFIFICPK
jgi:hypothetical protein